MMDTKKLLEKTASEFDLKYDPANKFKSLILTKREIIIRNFICGCPDPLYVSYGNKNNSKIGTNLVRFLLTNDYENNTKRHHACIISQNELRRELKLIEKIPDKKVKQETKKLYSKIKQKISKSKKLTLIWKPTKKEERSKQRREILFHEFIHELLEDNKIRPKSWKWNEGLVTYITYFVLNIHGKFEEYPPLGKDKMWNIYAQYTHKWAKILKSVNEPKERRFLILKKIRESHKK